jgi:hypothetical protein
MSSPEIDPVTAESEQQDADLGGEHPEPTYRDQDPAGEEVGTDESRDEGDSGGMRPG